MHLFLLALFAPSSVAPVTSSVALVPSSILYAFFFYFARCKEGSEQCHLEDRPSAGRQGEGFKCLSSQCS